MQSYYCIYYYTSGTKLQLRIWCAPGYDNGLTLKKFFAPASAAEFILSASPRHFQLTGLYEYQQPAGAPNLDWYLGIGAHLGGIHKNRDIMMVPSCWVQM